LNIACVNSNDGNFTGDLTTQTDNINLITIVASKPSLENEGKYLGLLKSIADKFRSELVLEEDDEGNENIMLS